MNPVEILSYIIIVLVAGWLYTAWRTRRTLDEFLDAVRLLEAQANIDSAQANARIKHLEQTLAARSTTHRGLFS